MFSRKAKTRIAGQLRVTRRLAHEPPTVACVWLPPFYSVVWVSLLTHPDYTFTAQDRVGQRPSVSLAALAKCPHWQAENQSAQMHTSRSPTRWMTSKLKGLPTGHDRSMKSFVTLAATFCDHTHADSNQMLALINIALNVTALEMTLLNIPSYSQSTSNILLFLSSSSVN